MKDAWVVQRCYEYMDEDGITRSRRWSMLHRRPDWMPLKLHIVLEDVLAVVCDVLDPAMNAGAYQVYNLLGGLICGFSMENILKFIRKDLRARRILREAAGARAL